MLWNTGPFLILVVEWLLVIEVSHSYVRNYNGYVFTLPDLNASRPNNEAQTWCAQNGSNLLEIKSSYIQTLTVQLLSDTGVYTGDGTLLFTSGIRNDGDWNWVNGQDINAITVTGQGQDLANSVGYINYSPSRLYITSSMPTDVRGYICQVAGIFNCTDGFSQKERCFKSYSSPTMSWFDARNRCLNDGGDLASFDFINDNQELNSTLSGSWLSSSATYWIGIRREWWTWAISNLEANYTNWLNGRPVYLLGIRCICLNKTGKDWKWIECSCSSVLPFICLTEPPATQSASTSSVTTPTMINTATPSSGFRNPSDIYSSPATSMALGGTDNRDTKLGIGVGVGIGGALLIAAIIIMVFNFIGKRGCPSYQTRPLTRIIVNNSGDANAVTQAHSTNRRNPQMNPNGTLEMDSERSTSPYESLQQYGTEINNRHYEELQTLGRGDASGPEIYNTIIQQACSTTDL